MKATHLDFSKTGFFSDLMLDYLRKSKKVDSFYNNFPDLEGFKNQITEKKSFSDTTRKILVESLQDQYKNLSTSKSTTKNINLLKDKNTFTITTGHQLNLFTGPLYFLYKIFSVINLCEELSQKFKDKNFVPVYWMATEDHDFDEINYFNYTENKIQWDSEQKGAVGRFSTNGLNNVFEEFSKYLGTSENAKFLRELFIEAYVEQKNLAAATRFIANKLFSKYGLIIVDGDCAKLKSIFKPYVKRELENQTSFKEVISTISDLETDYKVQVNPREINLFYLDKNLRERIIFDGNKYLVNNTDISFYKEEILEDVNNNPEKYSPNVILRPLYQEVILPNLCYVGGGGELAYWLQLKSMFRAHNVIFPILLLRNSVQVLSKKQLRKMEKLNISKEEIFYNQQELLAIKVKENSDLKFSFSEKKHFLKQQFIDLKEVAKKTDVTFLNAVNAQERKQIKGLEKLEKRLLKAERRRQDNLVRRITGLQNEVLPNLGLEERQRNFSEYFEEYGFSFLEGLKENLKPLQLEFTILEM